MGLRLHRPLEGSLKTVTISREADGWYAGCSCTEVPVEPLPLTGEETGIDVGLKVFLITADGGIVENPRHSRTAEKHLKKAQRRIARRKKGSKRRRKAVLLLKRKHQKPPASDATSITRRRWRSCANTTNTTNMTKLTNMT
jgi:putative transposase